MWITLSINSKPSIDLYAPTCSEVRMSLLDKSGNSTSLMRVDFPEPDTPVTQVNVPSGIDTAMFFKLCSLTPLMRRLCEFPVRRLSGIAMVKVPAKY